MTSTVHVDVCQPGRQCLRTGCTAPARLSVQRDSLLELHYCGPDARNRIAMHQRLKRTIVVSDEAWKQLAEVAL